MKSFSNYNDGMTITITIIDDDSNSIHELEKAIQCYFAKMQHQVSLKKYNSPETYLKDDMTSDIYFLDVEMPKINGIDLAHKIREKEKETIIFFCTNYTQFAINGYEVNALGYLVKPINDYSVSKNLNHAIAYLDEKKNLSKTKIQLPSNQGIIILSLYEIIYVEVKKHYLFYHLSSKSANKEKEIKIRGTMDSLEKALNNSNFAKTGNSFLVNLDYILAIKGNDVIMKEENSLILSRKYKKEFLDSFAKYLNKKETIIL